MLNIPNKSSVMTIYQLKHTLLLIIFTIQTKQEQTLFTKVFHNQNELRLSQKDLDFGVKGHFCSDFYQPLGLLVKGEINKKTSKKEKARIIITNPSNGKVEGKVYFFEYHKSL